MKCGSQNLFTACKERYIIGVFSTLYTGLFCHSQSLFNKVRKTFIYTVHEVTQIQVRKVLTEIITYRKTFNAVYNFVQQPQEVFVFQLAGMSRFVTL